MMKKRRPKIGRVNNAGYLFVLPFLIGLAYFFLPAVWQSMVYMFSAVKIELGNVDVQFTGAANFKEMFLVDTKFRELLLNGVRAMLFDTIQILIFSFFIAAILTQDFIGRSAARAVFFMPVILSGGVMAAAIASAATGRYNPGAIYGAVSSEFGSSGTALFDLQGFMLSVIPNETMTGIVSRAVNSTFTVINSSGVQILIFLTALHSISPSIFEASKVEGASKWEEFWKITFPMITPMIFVNIVYTVIDSFTNPAYGIYDYIRTQAFSMGKMGLASAMSWVYFVITMALLGIVALVSKRYTVYLDK